MRKKGRRGSKREASPARFPVAPASQAEHCRTMVRRRNFLLLFLAFAVPARAEPQALGIFGQWGAFRDPARCYAIAAPAGARRRDGGRAFASIGTWPARNI